MLFVPVTARAADPYFTLSTNQSFAPGEQPKLHLYTRNVDALEFRLYRVRDPESFAGELQEMHSFGDPSHAYSTTEQIDEKTWLERFHDWKRELWHSLKEFFRTQFSRPTREAFKVKQSILARRSSIVSVAQFAQVPLLNDKRLVARWVQQVPPTFVSDNQVLPIRTLDRGMYLVEATDGHLKAYTILLVSQTALVTRVNAGEMVTFAVDRGTGMPVTQASFSMQLGHDAVLHKQGDADGIAVFEHGNTKSASSEEGTGDSSTKFWAMARSGDDVALVAPWSYSFTQNVTDRFTSYVYTDRPAYRPGETVHFKGILREKAGNALTLPRAHNVHAKVTDDAGKVLLEKDLPLSAMGTVAADVALPADATLGFARISLEIVGSDAGVGSASFRIEEYRKPEYQVRLSAAKSRVLQGESDSVTIEAKYFFGEPVADAKVKYRVYQARHYWWDDPSDEGDDDPGNAASDEDSYGADGDQNSEQTGQLDRDGRLTIAIPTRYADAQRNDFDYTIEAGVTDEAGREITGRIRFLATHGSFRIHVEPVSYVIQQGASATLKVSAVAYDEHPVQTGIHLRLLQTSSSPRGITSDESAIAEADVSTGPDGSATAVVPVKSAGSLRVVATAQTSEKRTVEDTSYVWSSGSGDTEDTGQAQTLRILPDKKTYAPGDTAHLTVLSPVAGVHALVTATGNSTAFRKVIAANGKSLQFDVPIDAQAQPNLTVDVAFIRDDKLYQGRRSLHVPPVQQQLHLTVTPSASIFQPGQPASYDVLALDAQGRPVQAEMSLGVVDEALYALYPDTSGDIVKQLYPDRATYPQYDSSLAYYFTGEAGIRSPQLAQRRTRYGPQLAQVKPGNDAKAPRIRKDFPDTAFWQPSIRTDASGHAKVTLRFPDSLTTWRATVRAITADTRAGSIVNRVLVRKNVIVRMGQPRFLRKGDTVTVPVVAHNYLTEALPTTLSLTASGLTITGNGPRELTVQPRAEGTVAYHLQATTIGTATLTAKAISAAESDALQVSLPVQPDGVKQTLADSGALTNSAERTVTIAFPGGTDPAAHTLRITAAPSIAGTLFSALDYLTSFPYGCTEQTISSFVPDVLVTGAFNKLGVPTKENAAVLKSKVKAALVRLDDYHHSDGGWGWWKEDDSQVFMTAYVVSGLQRAVDAGYPEASAHLNEGANYLQKQLALHPRMLPELRAFVVYALALHKRDVASQLNTLYGRRSDLSPQALAYVGLAMLQEQDSRSGDIADLLEKKANVQGELASWPASRNNLLDEDTSESAAGTAIALKFLLRQRPTSPLLPKAAQWLALQRDAGEWWGSTQDTAFVLDGLTDYVAATHELDADLDVDLAVNGTPVAHRHFSREDAVHGAMFTTTVEAVRLQASGNSIHLTTRGSGRLYWSVQGDYYSTAKNSYQQGTMQLNIARDYSRLVPRRDNGHITYTLQPLNGPVQQGDVLAVHLGVTGSPQKYLLIEDPIAAGTEFVRNRDSYAIQGRPGTWTDWYTRQEFHDDRAAFFSTTFSGRQDLFYLVQVVNPGGFAISPARVTPMYQPGVQATTDALRLDVQEVAR